MAVRMDSNADEVLRNLLSGTHVHLSKNQRSKWTAYADASGVSLSDWIKLRVEAAIQYGTDPGTMHAALDHLKAITQHLGIPVTLTSPARPTGAREHQG